jgi:hypothetical protein
MTGIAIELFLLYVSLGSAGVKKIVDGLERLLKNPRITAADFLEYFKKKKLNFFSNLMFTPIAIFISSIYLYNCLFNLKSTPWKQNMDLQK